MLLVLQLALLTWSAMKTVQRVFYIPLDLSGGWQASWTAGVTQATLNKNRYSSTGEV